MQASNGRPMRAIAGPLMPDDDYARLQQTQARTTSSSSAPSPTSRKSSAARRASISQCGYNTALDLLRTRVPALVVPYATPEEDEQTRRARRLAAARRASRWRRTSTATSTRCSSSRHAATTLDLDGAATTRELLP